MFLSFLHRFSIPIRSRNYRGVPPPPPLLPHRWSSLPRRLGSPLSTPHDPMSSPCRRRACARAISRRTLPKHHRRRLPCAPEPPPPCTSSRAAASHRLPRIPRFHFPISPRPLVLCFLLCSPLFLSLYLTDDDPTRQTLSLSFTNKWTPYVILSLSLENIPFSHFQYFPFRLTSRSLFSLIRIPI